MCRLVHDARIVHPLANRLPATSGSLPPKGVSFMDALVHPKERLYFWVSLVVSLQLYVLLIVSIIGLFYIAIGVVIGIVVHGLLIGHLKGNAVRMSEWQFAEVHRMAGELAREMDLDPVPAVYVLQSGGVLNAFATKFLGRSFVVVNS